MKPEIKTRLAQIRAGEIPEGYKKGKLGIVPKDWEEINFSDLFTSKSEYTDDLETFPLYSLTIEDGITAKTDRYDRSHLVKKENSYKIVQPNDFAYNPMNIRFGAVARHKGDIPVAVSGYYDIFTTVHENDLSFMESFLTSDSMITYYNRVSTGSLVEKQRVHFSDFMKFSIPLPPLEERKKIAEILTAQDRIIELCERKIEQLKRMKKYYLQNMFPKDGKEYPEIRFKGFTDAWEQRKFNNTFDVLQNNALSRADLSDEQGSVMNVHYGDILVRFGEVLDVSSEKIPYLVDDAIAKKYSSSELQNGDIIIADAAEDETVGKCTEIANLQGEKVLAGLHTIPVRARLEFSCGYLGYYLNSNSYHDQLLPLMQGTKVSSISKSAIQDTLIIFPKSAEEQQRIGDYFRNLDNLITLHQRKCEEEKKKKKALQQLLLTGLVRV